MLQPQLNHCRILHVHKERSDEIDITKVAQKFIATNDGRKTFLEHFNELIMLLL